MYTYIPSFLDLPPSPPSHPQVITEPRAELPVLYSSFPLAVSFTQGSVYVTPDSSQASHPQPYPMSACPCICICTSTSASLFLPWNEAHLYNCSRFHIHALIYDICFSLSDLFHSIWQTLGPFLSLQMTQFRSFFWPSNTPLYVCITSSLSIHLSMDT